MDIRAIAKRVGFRGRALNTIVAIAGAESGYDPGAHNDNPSTGDDSWGLTQINMIGAMGPERLKQFGLKSKADLLDPETNLRVAFALSNGGRNFTPWSTYKSGAYKSHLGEQGAIVPDKGKKGTKAAAGRGPAVDTIDAEDMAAQYGWALSVLKSSPDLNRVFQQAVANTWSPARFVAEVRGTQWFRQHSASAREDAILRKSDPAEWRNRQYKARAAVQDMASQLGAHLGQAAKERIAANVQMFGWSDAQIRDTLAPLVKPGASGNYGGQAATNVEALRSVAHNNGVKIADGTLEKWATRMAAGEDPKGFETFVRGMAKTAFPSFAEQIDAGMDVADIAQPYVQTMAQTLELNPEQVNLFDPTIRKALQAQTADGKVAMKPLWQFENELRKDDRFDKTQAANQTAAKFADTLTKMFGAAA